MARHFPAEGRIGAAFGRRWKGVAQPATARGDGATTRSFHFQGKGHAAMCFWGNRQTNAPPGLRLGRMNAAIVGDGTTAPWRGGEAGAVVSGGLEARAAPPGEMERCARCRAAGTTRVPGMQATGPPWFAALVLCARVVAGVGVVARPARDPRACGALRGTVPARGLDLFGPAAGPPRPVPALPAAEERDGSALEQHGRCVRVGAGRTAGAEGTVGRPGRRGGMERRNASDLSLHWVRQDQFSLALSPWMSSTGANGRGGGGAFTPRSL